MKKKLLQIIPILITLILSDNFATPVDLWFEKANTYYENKAYDSAVVYYEKILESGFRGSDVYYNLGNAYFRLNKLGLAILHYEKARKLAPIDTDIITNIRFAQLNIVDRVPESQRSFLDTILWRLHTMFSLNKQTWVLFVCLMILSLSIAFGLFASHNVRLWLIYLASICIIFSTALGISIGIKIYNAEKKEFAIVLDKTVDAKNQPEGNKVLFTVHEGIKFQVRKTVDEWSFVSLPNGVSGWVESSSLGKI